MVDLNDRFNAIKLATNATDVEEILARMRSQGATADHLQNQRNEKDQERECLLGIKDRKLDAMNETKYSGERQMARYTHTGYLQKGELICQDEKNELLTLCLVTTCFLIAWFINRGYAAENRKLFQYEGDRKLTRSAARL